MARKNTITKKDIKHAKKYFVFSYLRLAICVILLAGLVTSYFFIPKKKYNAETTANGKSGELNLNAPKLVFHMIDVGSGDALVLQLPNDEIMMIDCGYSIAKDEYDFNTIHNYLKENIVKDGGVIDYIVNTHPDADHYNGFVKLLELFEIRNIYLPFVDSDKTAADDNYSHSPFTEDNASYGTFVDKAYAEPNAAVYFANQNISKIQKDNFTVTFHTPTNALASASNSGNHTNRISTMMTLEFGSQVFVFTGDAEDKTEMVFMDNIEDANTNGIGDMFENKSVYLKVAHHGTNTAGSTSQAFINFIRPNFAFISAGSSYDKKDGTIMHPHDDTLAKLKPFCDDNIFTTRFVGNVTAVLDGINILINGEIMTPTYNEYKIGGWLGGAAIIVVILCFYNYNMSNGNAEQKKKEKK
jgi:beta-lactamase superfamily II metal-dependent hydrolase